MRQFSFDHYLKGAPAPVWMTEGVPQFKKGMDPTILATSAGKKCGRTMDGSPPRRRNGWTVASGRRRKNRDNTFAPPEHLRVQITVHCEDGVILRYTIFWNVLKALAFLDFDSLLDVGGAEGYMSAVIGNIFGIRVRSCDLSEEACRRAREIFNIEADPVDGGALPYRTAALMSY